MKKTIYDRWSSKLAKAIQKAIDNKHCSYYDTGNTPKNIDLWSAYFEKLKKYHSKKEIRIALNWYCHFVGTNQYIPRIRSASDFYTKYDNLVNAISLQIQDRNENVGLYSEERDRTGGGSRPGKGKKRNAELRWLLKTHVPAKEQTQDEKVHRVPAKRKVKQNKERYLNKKTYLPAIIEKPETDKMLKLESPIFLMALYQFYYYVANWQGTNQPKATNGYCAKGLKCSIPTIARYKKVLAKLKLIKPIREGNDHYVRVLKWQGSKFEKMKAERDELIEAVKKKNLKITVRDEGK